MSLINDALKKTQRMRTDPAESAPIPGGYAGPRRGRGTDSGPSLAVMVLGGLLLVAAAVGGTVWLLKSKSTPSVAGAGASDFTPPGKTVADDPSPASPAPAPVTASTVPTVTFSTPVITLGKLGGANPVTAVPAVPVLAPAEPTTVAPEPASSSKFPINPNARARADVSAFVDSVHVTGVRFSETGSKVLMNDHLYKVNDIVDRVLNVRLIEVKNDSLAFVDENGAVYHKNF